MDTEFKKFHIFGKKEFERAVTLPASIIARDGEDFTKQIASPDLLWNYSRKDSPQIFFEKDFSMDILFKDIRTGEIPYLVVKSWYRDWVMGNEEDWKEKSASMPIFGAFSRNFVRVASSVSLAALAAWAFYRRGIDPLSFASALPYVALTQGGCCFDYEYMDSEGNYHRAAVLNPRSWKPNTEVIELPREAVRADNTVRMRITATKRHAFGFVGLVQNIEKFHNAGFTEEKLVLSRAHHNRLKTDVREVLMSRQSGGYVHTIPGDTVDVEISASERKLKKGERETYLIKSSGFYTPLRRESRELAGNWQERISDEAKSRLASLTPLKEYANSVRAGA